MSKYNSAFKLSLVRQALKTNNSAGEIAQRYGVESSIVRFWVELYRHHGEYGLNKKHSHYSAAFKLSVLTFIKRNHISQRQAAAIFNIRSSACISTWQAQYNRGGLKALYPKRLGRPAMSRKSAPQNDHQLSREELLKELEYLRAENAYLKKLDALLKEKAAQKTKHSPSGS